MKRLKVEPSVIPCTSFNTLNNSTNKRSEAATQATFHTNISLLQPDNEQVNLDTMPVEIFSWIVEQLSAKDIGRLSMTTKNFHAIISDHITGPSFLQRSEFIAQWQAYDEKTYTLDLRPHEVVLPPSQPSSDDTNYIDYLIEEKINSAAYTKAYYHELQKALTFLTQHQTWARSHIHTLIVPMGALFQESHIFAQELEQLAALLSGLRHLRMYCDDEAKRCTTKADKHRLSIHLKALRNIPINKVTITNSTAFYNSSTLYVPPLSVLSKVQEKFVGGVSIRDKAIFLVTSPTCLSRFGALAQTNILNNLPCIQLLSNNLSNEFYVPFIKNLPPLLAQGKLSQLTHLFITYQSTLSSSPEDAEDTKKFIKLFKTFFNNPEIRYLLSTNKKFSLQSLLGKGGFSLLQASFDSIESPIRAQMIKQQVPEEPQQQSFAELQQTFHTIIQQYQLSEVHTYLYREWLARIEKAHNHLYLTYFNQLQKFIARYAQQSVELSLAQLWEDSGFSLYQPLLPTRLQDTELGQRISAKAKVLLLETILPSLLTQRNYPFIGGLQTGL